MLFNLEDFPKIIDFIEENSDKMYYHEAIQSMGYPSTCYHDYRKWYMDDVEFTWFVLRWS